jgi:hypothetical protein
MKLPFDLGVKLFFRLLLPGFILTVGVLPCLFTLLDVVGLKDQHEVALVFATIVLGWFVVAADMPLYMWVEGRRYWPRLVRRLLYNSENARLKRLNRRIDRYYTLTKRSDEDLRLYVEASLEKRGYPMGADGERHAPFPTRLGNAITAFETYSMTRYNIEAIFYWPRIWVNLSKDLREEIDNQQAMADSTVYCTFTFAMAGFLFGMYGLSDLIATAIERLHIVQQPLLRLNHYFPDVTTSLVISSLFLLLSLGAYRLAVFTNTQFGELVMAVIDTHVGKLKSEYLDVAGISRKVMRAAHVGAATDEEKLEVTRRYLQYYNVKLPDQERPVPFPKVLERNDAKP